MKHLITILLILPSTSIFSQNLLFDSRPDTSLTTDVTENKALVKKIEKELNGLKAEKIYAAKWGDKSKREKYLVFTDSAGKVVVFQKGRRNRLEKMTFHHVFEGVCTYPETSEMIKILTVDFDGDGVLELLFIEKGYQRGWSDEMGSFSDDCCVYSVFKQYDQQVKLLQWGTFETEEGMCRFKEWNNDFVVEKWSR